MKRLLFVLFTLTAIMGYAQSEEPETWSMTTKWVLLGVWSFIIIVLALRTFRGKPDA